LRTRRIGAAGSFEPRISRYIAPDCLEASRGSRSGKEKSSFVLRTYPQVYPDQKKMKQLAQLVQCLVYISPLKLPDGQDTSQRRHPRLLNIYNAELSVILHREITPPTWISSTAKALDCARTWHTLASKKQSSGTANSKRWANCTATAKHQPEILITSRLANQTSLLRGMAACTAHGKFLCRDFSLEDTPTPGYIPELCQQAHSRSLCGLTFR
jgi:hypothetical protein